MSTDATSSQHQISSDSAKLLEEIFRETGFNSYASDSNLFRLKRDLDEQTNTVSSMGLYDRSVLSKNLLKAESSPVVYRKCKSVPYLQVIMYNSFLCSKF